MRDLKLQEWEVGLLGTKQPNLSVCLGAGPTSWRKLSVIYKAFFFCFLFLIYSWLLRQAGAALHRGARASHYRGLSCCGAQAPDVQAQELWLTGPAAPQHVGSSQTRA